MTAEIKPRNETPQFDILTYPRDVVPNSLMTLDGFTKNHGDSESAKYNTMLITRNLVVADAGLNLGMGVAHVDAPEGFSQVRDLLECPDAYSDCPLYELPVYEQVTYEDIADVLSAKDKIKIIGFLGRTGAGKSTTLGRIDEAFTTVGSAGAVLEIDSFFIMTRAERKAWLNEPGISDSERAERQRVANWWDFDQAKEAIEDIRQGRHVKIDNVYDMKRGGEKVGTVDIDPGDDGFTLFVEGTALLLPEVRDSLDAIVYLNTHDSVRQSSLWKRNERDGYTWQESKDRKALTDRAESSDHISRPLRHAAYESRRLAVLDNSRMGDTLTLLPPFIPEK